MKYVGVEQKIALNFRYDFLKEEIPTYYNGKLNDIQVANQQTFSLGFITTQSLKHSFYFGAAYQFNKEKTRFASILPEGIKHVNFDLFKLNLSYSANRLNDRNYPTKGREILVIVESFLNNNYKSQFESDVDSVYGLTENELNEYIIKPLTPNIYSKIQSKYFEVIPVSPKFQIIPGISAGVTLSLDSSAVFDDYRIGGNQLVKISDNRFVGLNFAEIQDQNFLIGGLFFQNVLFGNLFLKYGGNLLLHHEHVPIDNVDSFDFEEFFIENSVFGYGVQLTYKSPLGPISGGISRNSRNSNYRYYLAIGFSFNFAD